MSAAGPSRGHLRERGEARARRARPRAWVAADTAMQQVGCNGAEAVAPVHRVASLHRFHFLACVRER